jgi:hypothetical protein
MKMRSIWLNLALLSFCFIGCSNEVSNAQDSWYLAPHSNQIWMKGEKLDEKDFHEIAPTSFGEAEAILSDNPAIRIEDSVATKLVGKPISPESGKSLFLIRALNTNTKTGQYTVHSYKGDLQVNHAALGKKSKSPNRSALVVALSQVPNNVYVTYSVSE